MMGGRFLGVKNGRINCCQCFLVMGDSGGLCLTGF